MWNDKSVYRQKNNFILFLITDIDRFQCKKKLLKRNASIIYYQALLDKQRILFVSSEILQCDLNSFKHHPKNIQAKINKSDTGILDIDKSPSRFFAELKSNEKTQALECVNLRQFSANLDLI